MPITLKVTTYKGQPIGSTIEFSGEQSVSIGRSAGNNLVLPDQERFVSRNHANIRQEGGQYLLMDNSLSGTRIDQQPPLIKTEGPLNDGCTLTIGDFVIAVSIQAASAGAFDSDSFFADNASADGAFAPTSDFSGQTDSAGGFDLDSFFNEPAQDNTPFSTDSFFADQPGSSTTPGFGGDTSGLSGELAASPYDNPNSQAAPISDDPFSFANPAMADNAAADLQSFIPPEAEQPGVAEGGDNFSQDDFDAWFSGQTTPGFTDSPVPQAPPATPPAPTAPPVQAPPTAAPQAPVMAGQIPPQAPPAAAQPAPAAASMNDAYLQAFLAGAGLQNIGNSEQERLHIMQTLGKAYRETTQGMIAVLKARSELKNEFKMAVTTMAPVHNNPLKHFDDPVQALSAMLGQSGPGYMGIEEATREGFNDIKAHQMAMTAGMQAALGALLTRFDPKTLEARLQSGLVMQKKSKYWDIFTEEFDKIAKEAEDNFNDLFGNEFTRVYQEQVNRLRFTK